ncbi:lysophospholipid acyltransferase family protein [Bacillus sp. 1NLA3E]|uniref:lysophospholipid acyltransferase family protein n=1 Tax=Bacillus sp. 1NLA3E TaxID=666686 RepID=UPI000247F2A9|nr:lysophospholipid acyltransferase family protein [Bacillus sp. 1NLA3E]AGK54591.1 1-acyl-sn-glycerol-3-phosphate acyltransferase [Bacillus sp. 1NLA3E]
MLRLIAFLLYMVGFLVCSIPKLIKMKKLDQEMSVAERDRIIHEVPNGWAKVIMKITGSTIIVEGQENIPEGPVVFVCNHEGDFDIPVLLGYINKPFGFISKIEVSKVPILSTWMEIMNCVFLDRKDPRQAVRTIRKATELLKQGHSMVLFPEGTRSRGGDLGPFKTGGFRLAVDSKAPIVPITIKGTSDVFEKNGRLVRPATIRLTIDLPIHSHIQSNSSIKELAEETRQVILANLAKDTIAS